MIENLLHSHLRVSIRTQYLFVLLALMLVLLSSLQGSADDKGASNTHPLAFGKDQAIIDLNKVAWEPLTGEGIPPRSRDCAPAGESGCRGRRSARLLRSRHATGPRPH